MDDGRKKYIIDRKFWLATITVILIAIMGTLFWLDSTKAIHMANCSEYRLKGIVQIKEDSPLYEPRLDRNKNGIACE